MNCISERPASWEALSPWVRPFLESLGHKNDGFWDGGVFQAQPFFLSYKGKDVGFFALASLPEEPLRLHAFYLPPEYQFLAQDAFHKIVENYMVSDCMVPSNDELFVCLALEVMKANGGSLEMQAYNLTYGPPRREAEFGPEALFPVFPEEYPQMHRESENMWLDDACTPQAKFFRLARNGETLGYGSIYPRRLDFGLADIGNYVLPAHRGRGVGRSLIIQLSRFVLAEGKTPCAGCWYYNHASIRTLNSSGFIPGARLFLVHLHPEASPGT